MAVNEKYLTRSDIDSELLWEPGEGNNSVQQKGSNGTALGDNSVVEGVSVTNAIERGITSASTNDEIIAEWSGSTPDTDKFSLAKGEASHVEGNNGLALGSHSHVEGNGCIAGNNSAHAEGTGAQALGKYAHAEGLETIAEGDRSHAEGAWTKTISNESHAEGNEAIANARSSHAEGYKSITSKEGYSSNTLEPHAQGTGTSTWINACSHAEGNATIAQGLGAHSEGEKTFANSRNGHAEGLNTKTFGDNSHAEGEDSKTNTTAAASHVEGFDCEAGGNYTTNTKANYDSTIKGEMSHAEGNRTIANGNAAHSEGKKTLASGTNSHAEGYLTIAAGVNSHAEGEETKINTEAEASHVEGYNCEVGGNYTSNTKSDYTSEIKGEMAHAEGNSTIANGNAAHAEGKKTLASGVNSHAEGNRTTASEESSHAEGSGTTASGRYSHAEGNGTTARGNYSHAEGFRTIASNEYAHAEGYQTIASADASHAEGEGTQATNMGEHAEGQYNKSNTDTISSVGIGTSYLDRKNALEIMQNGDAYLYGVGGYNGTNATANTSSTLQQVLSNVGCLAEITWANLKALRDSSGLTPGMQYRITDYNCTTVQQDTQSANHPFDIIVVADDNHTLNENARAVLHSGDTYFSTAGAKLEAWELKYDLDNDIAKYAWADSGSTGRGVIYWMKDEWNNECPYDFKNIQFKTKLDGYGLYNTGGTDTYVWTFNQKIDGIDVGYYDETLQPVLQRGGSFVCSNNVIKEYTNGYRRILNENIFLEYAQYYDGYWEYVSSHKNNFLNINCNKNIFNNGSSYNVLWDDCYSNIFYGNEYDGSSSRVRFGAYCHHNTFGDRCYDNTLGDNCSRNIFGDNCYSNAFGDGCSNNTFGDDCYNNTFGNECGNNTFGYSASHNTFGDNCNRNTFGDDCYNNTVGNSCVSNTFGDMCNNNTFGYYSENNTFGNECGNNTFGDYCGNNTFGDMCYAITFGNGCKYNTFGDECGYNTFGNSCNHIKFGNASSTKSYCSYNIIESGNQYIYIDVTSTTSDDAPYRNVKIAQGVNNTITYKTIQDSNVNQTYQTVYQPANSQVINV